MEIKPELRSFLDSKKMRYRPGDGENLAIQVCPFCGKSKWKFSIHSTSTKYRCWTCGERGNLYKLKQETGDTPSGEVRSGAKVSVSEKGTAAKPIPTEHVERWHKKLLESTEGLKYCESRGFSPEAIKTFRLGLQRKRGVDWLTIPHFMGGQCWNVKFRSLPPTEKKFRRVKGSQSVLFNADCLADHEEIVLAEAETDAISFWSAGVKNVVSLTCGADTFLPEWYDAVADKEKIVLALDADTPGQNGARSIARRVGFDKCYNVLLPAHDANEVLTTLGPDKLRTALEVQEQFEIQGVLTLDEVLLQCIQAQEVGEEGLLTPWESVNRLIRPGWLPGDLIILSAKVKVGKTTLALNIADNIALQGIPSLVYCMEMKPRRIGNKIVAMKRKKASDLLKLADYNLVRYYTRGLPIYFIDPNWGGKIDVDAVFDKIRETVKRYGIKFMVFDHLHFLCRSIQNLTNEIGQVVRRFKLLAEELEIVVLLIAQPKKIQGSRIITYDDIKDSSAIPADADQILLMHRNKIPAGASFDEDDEIDKESDQEVLESKTLIRVDAARFQGGGETFLHYEGPESMFYEMDNRPIPSL